MNKTHILKLLLAATIGILSATAYSSDLEIGVCTHMGQNRYSWSQVKAAMDDLGVTSFRDEIYWKTLERTDKSITLSATPTAIQAALAAYPNYRGMLIADYGHPNYDEGNQPYSDAGRNAYARYAGALLNSYGNSIAYLELWNEWNLGMGNADRTPGSAAAYAALVKTSVPVIAPMKKSSRFLIGATGDDLNDWSWTKSLFSNGVASLADGYSVHLYNYMAGSKAVPAEMFARLERLQSILTSMNNGTEYPIYVTEFGWPTNDSAGGVSQELSGAYIARFIMQATAYKWLKGVWIYDLFNDGTDTTDREQNFGLYNPDGTPKAGTCSVRSAISLVHNYRYINKGIGPNSVSWLQYENTTASTTVFVLFNGLKGGSSYVALNAKPSALCDSKFSPPTAPTITQAIHTANTTTTMDSSSPSTATGSDSTAGTFEIGEIPQVIFIKGTGKTASNIFSSL